MTVKLHRCGLTFIKSDGHPCWKVEKALEESGIDYEVVLEPTFPRGRRKDVIEHTDQSKLPVIETSDGEWVRDEGSVLAERVATGDFS